jgi:shikimate kinase/3-dehydroquinate synthase
MVRSLVIVGFMGAGKTKLGRRLAEARGVPHLDTDTLIVEKLGKSVAEIFSDDGEAAFRNAERDVVLSTLAKQEEAVISLGGGAPAQPEIASVLANHPVLLLDVALEAAWERAADSDRPLASSYEAFAELYANRKDVYERVADAVIVPTDKQLLIRADQALRAFAEAPAGTKMTWGSAASGEYPVFVGPGVLSIKPPGLSGRTIIVTDETVGSHYAGVIEGASGLIEIPPGEEHKTLATTERVWQAMVAQSVTRTDHLLALGGGVVGDLAGYAAACFQRGIAVVQAPTTIVSQVDSAYGGKTGVDLPEAKNYVGAYHQPAAVLADTSTLTTLPPEEHAAGYAEVLKTALIAGGQLWQKVSSGAPVDASMIFGCARTKLAIVAADERDGGRRQVLNLGHTIGHALEVELGYGTLRHGEAVGLGMLAALRLSGQSELRDQVKALLSEHQLPVALKGHEVDVDSVLRAVTRDKKRVGDTPTPFVLVRGPGKVEHGCEVAGPEIEASVRELMT